MIVKVENECTSHNSSFFAIFLLKITKIGGNLTKFWQKQFCTVFWDTVYVITHQLYRWKSWAILIGGILSWRVTFLVNIYGPIGEWPYCNLPLKVFTKRNFVPDFIRLKLHFSQIKNLKNRLLSHPLGDIGVTYGLARCKARGGLPIRHNWTFFAISYVVETL